MIPDKEKSKVFLLKEICTLTYLIMGVLMLTSANSILQIIISGIILSVGTIMYYIIYIKKESLTGDMNE